ncbi:MAG: DUF5399 family protein [Chlamydiia bacterium]|nr:DUF5399 family protein [Chlamydiia bacterium]
MSVNKPRTIDNLGVEASVRYAKDTELFESRYIEESRLIAQKTEVQVVSPSVLSEFDRFYSSAKTAPWALFYPPPEYLSYGKPLFSYQLIPSLGEYDKLEEDIDKLEQMGDALEDEQEGHQKDPDQEKQRQALVALFRCLNKLDKTLLLINARRNQYQRG